MIVKQIHKKESHNTSYLFDIFNDISEDVYLIQSKYNKLSQILYKISNFFTSSFNIDLFKDDTKIYDNYKEFTIKWVLNNIQIDENLNNNDNTEISGKYQEQLTKGYQELIYENKLVKFLLNYRQHHMPLFVNGSKSIIKVIRNIPGTTFSLLPGPTTIDFKHFTIDDSKLNKFIIKWIVRYNKLVSEFYTIYLIPTMNSVEIQNGINVGLNQILNDKKMINSKYHNILNALFSRVNENFNKNFNLYYTRYLLSNNILAYFECFISETVSSIQIFTSDKKKQHKCIVGLKLLKGIIRSKIQDFIKIYQKSGTNIKFIKTLNIIIDFIDNLEIPTNI